MRSPNQTNTGFSLRQPLYGQHAFLSASARVHNSHMMVGVRETQLDATELPKQLYAINSYLVHKGGFRSKNNASKACVTTWQRAMSTCKYITSCDKRQCSSPVAGQSKGTRYDVLLAGGREGRGVRFGEASRRGQRISMRQIAPGSRTDSPPPPRHVISSGVCGRS